MIYITSKPVIEAIKNSCPININGRIDQVVLISESDKQFVHFETSEGKQKFLCHWWINVYPELKWLNWRFLSLEINSIAL